MIICSGIDMLTALLQWAKDQRAAKMESILGKNFQFYVDTAYPSGNSDGYFDRSRFGVNHCCGLWFPLVVLQPAATCSWPRRSHPDEAWKRKVLVFLLHPMTRSMKIRSITPGSKVITFFGKCLLLMARWYVIYDNITRTDSAADYTDGWSRWEELELGLDARGTCPWPFCSSPFPGRLQFCDCWTCHSSTLSDTTDGSVTFPSGFCWLTPSRFLSTSTTLEAK